MSRLNRSLVLEEIKESQEDFIDLLPVRYLSIRNDTTEGHIVPQVVKVCGTITVSF